MGSERSNQGGKMTRQLNNLDRISELPECLIVEILSLLEMKDAVKTGVLSKRWEKLWTSVDCIIYHSDVEEPTDEQLRLFMSFADDTLMQCTCPNIKKFSLTGYGFLCSELSHNMDTFFQVNDWIKFVLDKNIQSMKLGLSGLIDYGPCCLFGSPSLVSLEIYEIGSFDSFNIYSVRCNLLKHLSFKSVSLEKKFMTKVLLGCPVLETMVLDDTRGFSRLDITSKSLKMLKLCNFEYDDFGWDSDDEYDDYQGNRLVEVNAPWVQDLEISGLFEGVQCQLMDVSSVSTATLTFSYQAHRKVEVDPDGMWFNMVKDILEPVSHVDDLVIGSELVQALSLSYNFYGPSPVFKCKYLTVCSPILKYELPGIIYLLENTTLLERLVLKLLCSQCYFSEYFATIYKEEFTFDALKYVVTQLKGDFPKLKYLEIDYIVMGRQDKGDEMVMESFHQELAFKINRNVSSLEKVVILSLQSENNKLAKAYEKLLSYHKRIGKWELKRMQCRSEFSFCDSAS